MIDFKKQQFREAMQAKRNEQAEVKKFFNTSDGLNLIDNLHKKKEQLHNERQLLLNELPF